jgi:Mg2+-importing ATPase
MLYVFKAKAPLFQTAWFVESLFTQTLVIFVIRTRTVPFFNSKPNKWLTINIAVILGLSLILPFTPLGKIFNFVPLPWTFLLVLVGFIIAYLFLVELMKIWFYKHNLEPTNFSHAPKATKS